MKRRAFLFFLAWALLPALGFSAELPPGAKVLTDLPYVTNGHRQQKLDLYLPAAPKGPLVVYIHGGGWVGGSKAKFGGTGMLAQGYALASIEYRFSTDAIFPAQIEDCKAAIRWLRAHATEYGYDPKKVAAWGESAGGHLTALLATTGNIRDFDVGENLDQSSAIRCGVDFFGPTDLPGYRPPSENPGIQRTGSTSILTKLLGGELEQRLELARRASPITWVTKETAPLYIVHGTKDPLVGVEQSQELADKMKAAGVEVTLDIVKDGGHGGDGFLTPERIPRLLSFFAGHLAAP